MFWAIKKVRMAFSLLDPSTAPSRGPLVTLFLGVLLGGLGLLWGWAFLLRKLLGTEFWPSTNSKRGDGICRIGATCVKRKRKLLIIYSCFVKRLQCFGVWFSPFLVCSGFCILQLKWICLVGMVPLWVREGRDLLYRMAICLDRCLDRGKVFLSFLAFWLYTSCVLYCFHRF